MSREPIPSPRVLTALCCGIAAAVVGLATPATAGAQSLDALGRPTEPILGSLEGVAQQPFLPESARESIAKLVGFFRGDGEPGVPLPTNGPLFAQFAYPTVMQNCIGGKQTAVGTAAAIPGPAALPLPGIPTGHTGFIFTALGTEKVSATQAQPLTVEWFNVNNGRRGSTPLTFTGVNADGPATVNGVADTGAGTVLMLLNGGLTTTLPDGGQANCQVIPTVGSVNVR